ncbi:MAG: Hpt domain-containing protein [Hyphomicrobiaceae bacterium]
MNAVNSIEADSAQTPVLNKELLDQYRSRKSSLLERLISAWLEEAPRFFQEMRKAAEDDSLQGIRAQAHALKSCCNNLGASRLAGVCQNLETAALENDSSIVAQEMEKLGPEFFEAEQALRGELFKLNPDANIIAEEKTEEPSFSSDWV